MINTFPKIEAIQSNGQVQWIVAEIKKNQGIDLADQPGALQRINEEAERAKAALLSAPAYTVNLPFIWLDATGPIHIQLMLTRAKMQQLCAGLPEQSGDYGRKLLEEKENVSKKTEPLIQWMVAEIKKNQGIDLASQPDALQRIKE